MNEFDVGIVGCGVAGMTAAIYLKRAGLSVVIFEKNIPGGQLINNDNIENYPGYLHISGSDLSLKMLEQIKELEIPIKYENVCNINADKELFTNKNKYCFDSIIIASGRSSKRLGILGEDKYNNRGVSYCPVCDGMLYKDKDVIVVGGGDGAFEGALYLSKIAKSITIFYRNEIKAQKYLGDKVNECKNILLKKAKLLEIDSKEKLLVKTNVGEIKCDGIFVCIGQEPQTSFLESLNICDDFGYVKTNSEYETDIEGIYAIGDSIKKRFYQIVIAMGEASLVALLIANRKR